MLIPHTEYYQVLTKMYLDFNSLIQVLEIPNRNL